MTTRDEVLAANAAGTLIEMIDAADYSRRDSLAHRLSEMHNSGDIDFFASANSSKLDTIDRSQFFRFQHIFCLTLPRIQCQAEDAMAASAQMRKKAGADLTADSALKALREWFLQSPGRTE